MRRILPAGIASVAIAALFVAGLCGSAFAYFSTTGAGSATAGLPKLSAPTISSAVPAIGGTVALTWTAVTPPGSGTVTYSVLRDGGEPAGNCPSAATPGAVTTCTDSGLAVGTHTYTVSARWHSWNATSGSAQAKVTVGAATHFTIGAASATPGAGVGDNLTITALDEKGSTVTSYSGSHSLIFSGASASPGGNAPTVANSSGTAVAFGSATSISFTLGVASVVSSTKNGLMKLYKAGAASVSVSDGSIASEVDLAVTVASGATSKITLSAASTTPTAGAADNLTTTAYDAYGNVATAYAGSHNLTFSTASASPSGEIPTVTDNSGAATAFGSATAILFTAGVASVSGSSNGVMQLYKSGATSLKASDGTFTSATITVTVAAAAAVKLSLSAASTTPTAAASDNLTTTALDAYGNVATAYTGAHNITFSGATASPSGAAPTVANSSGTAVPFGTATAISFTAGVATVVSSTKNGVMKLNKVETAGVTATDGSISTSSGLTITVSIGAATKLSLAHVTVSAGSIGAGCFFTCAITGLGNSGTVKANVAVTDSVGNPISELGIGHAVKITATGGTVTGSPLTISSTSTAESTAQFTYTSKSSGNFTDTITAATSEGAAYTSATATASK
ncbi:MAG TPA: hypothetical protein VIM28_07150 [Solirubrobacterales bacterium]